MIDYICTDCGATFEEPRNDYHIYYGCPYCGGDCERAYPCEVCGELVPDSKYAYHLCDSHKKVALDRFKSLIASNFSAHEIQYLEDKTNGAYWREL